MFVDTHCHIHEPQYAPVPDEIVGRARAAGVRQMICVGTSQESSRQAVAFASAWEDCYASIGVHPHDTKEGWGGVLQLAREQPQKLVAVGEIGLDYFYTHSPREVQIEALEAQLQCALDAGLPVIFHVREAFNDFWPVFSNFSGVRGVLHSFTDTRENADRALTEGLYIGVNGISTFTKDAAQKELYATLPLNRILLETDAPFLTPVPKRGTVNEPAFLPLVAEHQASVRQTSVSDIAAATTANAHALFALS